MGHDRVGPMELLMVGVALRVSAKYGTKFPWALGNGCGRLSHL